MTKREFLKPHLLRSIEQLQAFIRLNVPAPIVGMAAWNVFKTTVAAYGTEAGWPIVDMIREDNLKDRGLCINDDCTNAVDRPGVGMCEPCKKLEGLDDETIDAAMREAEQEPRPSADSHLGHRGTE
jgi:hypothetical protein